MILTCNNSLLQYSILLQWLLIIVWLRYSEGNETIKWMRDRSGHCTNVQSIDQSITGKWIYSNHHGTHSPSVVSIHPASFSLFHLGLSRWWIHLLISSTLSPVRMTREYVKRWDGFFSAQIPFYRIPSPSNHTCTRVSSNVWCDSALFPSRSPLHSSTRSPIRSFASTNS